MYTHVNKCKNDKIIVLKNRDFKYIPTDEFQNLKKSRMMKHRKNQGKK
jgi:hypothetical protein